MVTPDGHLAVSPAEVAFGEIVIDGYRWSSVAVTNVSEVPVEVAGELVADPPVSQVAAFSLEPEQFSLAAGQAAKLALRFDPQVAGEGFQEQVQLLLRASHERVVVPKSEHAQVLMDVPLRSVFGDCTVDSEAPRVGFWPAGPQVFEPGVTTIVGTTLDQHLTETLVFVDGMLVGHFDTADWSVDYDFTAGPHTIEVRAADLCQQEFVESASVVSKAEEIEETIAVYTPVESPRGRRPNKSFLDPSDIESIDTSSGNVTLRVPLGQVFNVGPLLSYRLGVVHNSNVWDNVVVDCLAQQGGVSACNVVPRFDFPVPNLGSNAGLGWEFHFGKLYQPWVGPSAIGLSKFQRQRLPTWRGKNTSHDVENTWTYVAPDGSRHDLLRLDGRDNQHAGRPVRYSKDGSFLRLLQVDDTTIHVEQPNGVVSIFKNVNEAAGTEFCGGGVTGCWRFEQMTDPFGNSVSVTYARDAVTQVETWTISDSTGRQHVARFSFDPVDTLGGDGLLPFRTDEGDEWGDMRRVLTQVDVAAFGGARLLYEFNYDRDVGARRGCSANLPPAFATMTIPVLQGISIKEGEVEVSQPWEFDTNVTGVGCLESGTISKVTAPSQAAISYAYGTWRTPTDCVYTNVDPNDVDYTTFSTGIRTRTTHLATGVVEGVTSYSSSLSPLEGQLVLSGQGCTRADLRTTKVSGPVLAGKRRQDVFYHSVTRGPRQPSFETPDTEWQITDHGLPINKEVRTGGPGDYRFLSHQVRECAGSVCTTLRESFKRYATQFRGRCKKLNEDPPSCWQVDAMLVRTLERFNDDDNRFRETVLSGYNGAGGFREETFRDDFSGAVQEAAVETDLTATGATSLAINAVTGYVSPGMPVQYLPTPAEAWVLHPYNSKTWTGPGARSIESTTSSTPRGPWAACGAGKTRAPMAPKTW